MVSEFDKAIINIHEVSKITDLYRKMQLREGKMVIHRGDENPIILFVGEAGGKDEDREGKPFIGRSGKILNEWINFCNYKKYAVINAVPIMPENDGRIRKPTDEEINYFRPHIIRLINAMTPKFIVMVGRSAENCLSSKRHKVSEWDKKIVMKYGIVNFGFIYHPSYYLRKGQNGKKDFIKLMRNI